MESDSLKKENIFSLSTLSITIFFFGAEQEETKFNNKNKDDTSKVNFLIFIIILCKSEVLVFYYLGSPQFASV
jgi:hypothetical protein